MKTSKSSIVLRTQLLTTTTVLMLVFDQLKNEPADLVKSVAGGASGSNADTHLFPCVILGSRLFFLPGRFIDMHLLGVLPNVNDEATAILRQVACQVMHR